MGIVGGFSVAGKRHRRAPSKQPRELCTSRAQRHNLFIKIPGMPAEGVIAIEAIDLLRHADERGHAPLFRFQTQYVAAAEAYMREIARQRLDAGLDPRVASVASLFVSRWDVAVKDKVPQQRRNRLGIAVARQTYKAYRSLLASPRWRTLAARRRSDLSACSGPAPVRKDPDALRTLYIEALAAPDTINTIPGRPCSPSPNLGVWWPSYGGRWWRCRRHAR